MERMNKKESLNELYEKSSRIAEECERDSNNTLYKFVRRFTKSTMINSIEDNHVTRMIHRMTLLEEYSLGEDLKFLKKLKRDELLYIVLKKCIYHTEELVIDDICDFYGIKT